NALVDADSAALAIGGAPGVGVSFAGVGAYNQIAVATHAYIDGSGSASLSAGSLTVTATDTATINAGVAAASVAAGFSLVAGVAVGISLSYARNTILNDQQAYVTGFSSLSTGSGAISVGATESATIPAGAVAASVSLGGAAVAGVAVSGAATIAENLIKAKVDAYITSTTISSAGAISVTARDTSAITAVVDAASAALGGGLVG